MEPVAPVVVPVLPAVVPLVVVPAVVVPAPAVVPVPPAVVPVPAPEVVVPLMVLVSVFKVGSMAVAEVVLASLTPVPTSRVSVRLSLPQEVKVSEAAARNRLRIRCFFIGWIKNS